GRSFHGNQIGASRYRGFSPVSDLISKAQRASADIPSAMLTCASERHPISSWQANSIALMSRELPGFHQSTKMSRAGVIGNRRTIEDRPLQLMAMTTRHHSTGRSYGTRPE